MTRRRSSPLGLELVLSVMLALVVLPLLSHGAPVQESNADLQRYSEGCYYNYNHYSEGDRILTNEPCLNCTCHNKMLMCYLRVCPFTKPIGHDCTVEKREDQCCPIVTCPEVPVDVAHHSHQLTTSAPGTELSIPEKYGCSIDNKFYVEGAQVPSKPNKPCELCYCIRNRTACLMQECTLHIDGCQPIYNKGSCCPVRYNCDHENELLEIEDFSTTTTTVRPTEGYLLPSTTSPSVTTDCFHNNEVYADGASITGKSSCEHCYCMRGDIVCAVQECEMPILESGAKFCRALPPAAGECCPSNYACDDDSVTTEVTLIEDMLTTITPIQSDLHESVSQEDVQLQEHIDDKIPVTEVPTESVEQSGGQKDEITPTTILPMAGEVSTPSEVKDSEVEEEKPVATTVSSIKETSFETTLSPIEHTTTHKTEERFESSHKDKEDESIHPPKEDEMINEEIEEEDVSHATTTVSPVVGDIHNEDDVLPTKVPVSSSVEETPDHSIDEESNKDEEDTMPLKEEGVKPNQVEGTSSPQQATEEDELSTASTVEIKKPETKPESFTSTTLSSVEESDDMNKKLVTEAAPSVDTASESAVPVTSVASKEHVEPEEILPGEVTEKNEKPELESENISSTTLASDVESEGVNKIPPTEDPPYTDSASETTGAVSSVPSKSQTKPEETSSESVEFSEESTTGQVEIQDKIDEDISKPSSESSTSSPVYQVITEGDNSNIGMPEIEDHKTETDLPKKKPKDEPEPIEGIQIPSDVAEDEIPQVLIDSTTVHTVDTSTQKPSAESDSNELTTSKPSITKVEETLDQTTQGPIKEKPVHEDEEISAVVEVVTEVSGKPVSSDILDEENTPAQTTALPIKDATIDEVSESQENEEELSTEPSSTEKRTTTGRPFRIHIAGEEGSSEITTKGIEKEFADSTTSVPVPSVPSIIDSNEAVTDREAEGIEDSSIPSVIDSGKPSAEVEIKDEEDTKLKAPSSMDGVVSIAEKGDVKPEKETENPIEELSTPPPSKASEPEQDSATIIPLDFEPTITGDKEEDGKPETGVEDSTTSKPFIDETEENAEEEQHKIEPEQDIQSSSLPTDSQPDIMKEEEHQKKTEQSLLDSTTKHEIAVEDEGTSTEEYVTKGKPQFDATEKPVAVDHGTTDSEEDGEQLDTQSVVASTISPSESKPDISSNEENVEVEPELDTSDSTTIDPNVVSFGVTNAEAGIHKVPEISEATTGSLLPEEDTIKEKEPSIDGTSPTVSSVDESATTAKTEIEKQPIEGDSDSTTIAHSIADESVSSEEDSSKDKTPTAEDNITQQPSVQHIADSTTVVPSDNVSNEEVEDVLYNLTTVSPFTSDSNGSVDKEIKKQPEQELMDSSTKTSVASSPETSTTSDQKEKEQQATTKPSLAESEESVPEEEEKDDFSTSSPSLADSDTLSQTTDASVLEDKQDTPNPTASAPQEIESEQPSTEAVQDKQPFDKDDATQTSLSPIVHSDKESSESTNTTEGSGVPLHDIIPSAIPGEGDCLANGNTFANNATVPTSSECDLSCTCINSIIVCKKVQCDEPPKPNNCVLDEASTDKCCPQYICGIDSFAENQRPTTPEEVEDEEIQFTTLAPSRRYPDTATESATSVQKIEEEEPFRQKETSKTELPVSSDENTTPIYISFEHPDLTPEDPISHIKGDEIQEISTDTTTESATSIKKIKEEEPFRQEETSKTELPVSSDENTTPISIDFEQPALTPEDPMSHIKGDETQETSTKHSDEDTFVEGSTTIQPITTKPTKQVTGDIEEPIEVTSSVPEYSIPSKKPEEFTTLGASYAEEQEQEATTPTYQKLPSTSDAVAESEKTIIPVQDITTDDTLEIQATTLPPTKTGSSIQTTSVPAVVQTDDSAQSEETPETSYESSNESGEETDSDEITKSPMLHKKDDQNITTSRPIISEHVGDIEPIDESTRIPEMEYNKPEMPEDLSHTKVEEPAKPIASGELESNQESEESSEQIITTPASTILKPVEASEDDIHKVDVGISNEKHDIPSSDSKEEEKPHADKPISSTIKPIKSEEETDLETITESKKDVTETQTSSPIPVSGDESDLEKDQTPIQTIAPVYDEEITIAGDITTSTSAPAVEELSIEGSGANNLEQDSGDKKDDVVSSTSVPTIGQTSAPISSHESSEDEVEIPSGAPAIDGHTPTAQNEYDNKNEETPSQTSQPTIEEPSFEGSGAPSSDIDLDALHRNDVTTTPTVEEHAVEGSGLPNVGDKSQQDEITSQTSIPAIDTQHSTTDLEEDIKIDTPTTPIMYEEHAVEGSGAPISEDTTSVEQDAITSQTTAPISEKQPSVSDLEEENNIDVTSSPTDTESNGAPVFEDKTDIEKDEIVGQTSTPSIEKQPSTSDLEEENKIAVTSSPAVEEGSGSPISEDKTDVVDEIASQTTIPTIEKQPSISDLEEENRIDATSSPALVEGSGLSVSQDKTDVEQDEIASQTSTPAIDKKPTTSDLQDENKLDVSGLPSGEEHSVEGSGLPTTNEDVADKEQTDTQTKAPISEEELVIVAVTPVSQDEDHSVYSPVTESEEVISNQTNAPNVNVPSSEEESNEDKTSLEIQTATPSHGLDDNITPQIPTSQTEEKESHDSTSSSEEGEDISSGTISPVAGDKYEETELPEDTKPAVSTPISGAEKESDLTTVSTDVTEAPAGSIPVKDMDSNDENIVSTEDSSKDTSTMVSGDEHMDTTESPAISIPVKTVDEEKEISEEDKTGSTISPIKTVDDEGEILDATELPSSSTPAKPIDSVPFSTDPAKPFENADEELEATEVPQVEVEKVHTSEEDSSAENEPALPVTQSSIKLSDEVLSQTQVPISSDSNDSEEEVSTPQTEEQGSNEKEHKTLLTTESALPASETVSPSFVPQVDEFDSEDKISQITTDKPSTQLELLGEETSTKSNDGSEIANVTEMPEIISSHDQILGDDITTAKPSADVVPDQSESSADGKKPSPEESQTITAIPAVVDKLESDERLDTPESVEEESPEDTESKTPEPVAQAEIPVEQESLLDTENKTHKPVAQAEIPTSLSSEQDEDAKLEDIDKITTVKPTDNVASTESQEDNLTTKTTTSKPAEEIAPNKFEEQDDIKVSSTVIPVDQQPITSSPVDLHADSDHTSSTEKSDEEKEHTETPKDDTKIQTFEEFVTERAEDITTVRPNEDNEIISEQPISQELPELPETATSLAAEEEVKGKPEVSITTEKILPTSSSAESEEKIPEVSTEIAAEDTKPEIQPIISSEQSEEKTEAPEITSEIPVDGHKPQVQESGSVDESEDKTQAPEIQPEIFEEDHKQHIQPTEGAITSSTSDKPIEPTAGDKIDSDLPKPISTDEQPTSEDETSLSTTIQPLYPHIEYDRTTSTPQLNATDKFDHKIPESSSPSIPTTEQPTSQAITNAPTAPYQPPGYGQVPPQYPSYTEDEYTDEDETEVFGPGTCRYGGKLFVSAQQIPRDDPCDFCFCFRSDIICLQQSCPPPISGCHEEPISGFCCPRYECPVSMATTLNITTSTTTTSTTLPPHFLHHAYRGAAAKNGCHISGKSYKVGDKIDSASGPCMHCTCGGDGQMKCDPKTCSPEPMLRQMIAVVASRRR